MKNYRKIVVLSLTVLMTLGFTSCGNNEKITIEVDGDILINNTGQATTTQTHTHSFGEWVVVKEATVACEGLKERYCTCGEKETETIPQLVYQRVDEDGNPKEDGDYIFMGWYPQRKKDNSETVSKTPSENGYYLGSEGNYYAISSYLSSDVGVPEEERIQYYFLVEPIKWKIITIEDGTAFIWSDLVLDAKQFQEDYFYNNENYNYYNTSPGTPEGKYGNNYMYSTVRSWLCGDFYKNCFSQDQQEIITSTIVNNSVSSTQAALYEEYKNTEYVCDNTEDKIFLLSFQDITNPKYGFPEHIYSDSSRKKNATDYATAHSPLNYKHGETYYLLRSPFYANSLGVGIIDYYGSLTYLTIEKNYGIVPAMKIKL